MQGAGGSATVPTAGWLKLLFPEVPEPGSAPRVPTESVSCHLPAGLYLPRSRRRGFGMSPHHRRTSARHDGPRARPWLPEHPQGYCCPHFPGSTRIVPCVPPAPGGAGARSGPGAEPKRWTLRTWAGHKVPMRCTHVPSPPWKRERAGFAPQDLHGRHRARRGSCLLVTATGDGREEPSRENKKSQLPAPVPKPAPVPEEPPGASNNQKQELRKEKNPKEKKNPEREKENRF